MIVVGTPLTLQIGLIAGFLGVGFGAALAFIAAYYGGKVDTIIKGLVDIGLTVPGLMILITVAMNVRGGLNVTQMALVVASLAWLYPTRTIRAQVLTLRERGYIQIARLSGMSGPEIIVREMLPNLLPVPRRRAGQRDLGGDPGLDRPGSARASARSRRRRSA